MLNATGESTTDPEGTSETANVGVGAVRGAKGAEAETPKVLRFETPSRYAEGIEKNGKWGGGFLSDRLFIYLIRRSSKELSLNSTYNTMLKNYYKLLWDMGERRELPQRSPGQ